MCDDKQRRLGVEGSLSKVGIPPPHNLDIPHSLVSGFTHTHTHMEYDTLQRNLLMITNYFKSENGKNQSF